MVRTTLILSALLAGAVSAALVPQHETLAPGRETHIGTPVQHISPDMVPLSHPRIPVAPQAIPHNAVDDSSALEAPALETRKHHSKGKKVNGGKVTYYYGSQLLNPACPGAPTPSDSSMTAAISFDSPFQCGDRIKISDPQGKHAVVTVVDRCAGCTWNWIDVTKGVFQVFSGLDAGVLTGLTMTKQ
ncbi:hypothetical protein PaG_00157 [Moesziomyces aphidis]|jgi:hypothetical protein|uniref:RlpA-like protein double-psi beta-barrel domain-containing protein n=2 Tax=Moesziomyces TaxID=63261 RepID=M9MC97_PSEA3|nr:hypothetical protein PaG_00157 [Moesziomyces aphidis]KAI3491139.1 hypothetical protein L1887_44537 [Cichorium endivia]GAC71532.1 hypothetical protein PANT_3d00086 [Moesziomyces antarcticus T-34]